MLALSSVVWTSLVFLWFQFGVGDSDKGLIAVVVLIAQEPVDQDFIKIEIEQRKSQLREFIEGSVTESGEAISKKLLQSCDIHAIAKIHKVQDKKSDKHFLSELLVSRIATKDLMWTVWLKIQTKTCS